MNRKYLFLTCFLFLFLITPSLFAQEDSSYVREDKKEVENDSRLNYKKKNRNISDDSAEQDFKDNVFIGLYPGFSLSNYYFSYEVSPLIAIDITEKFSSGIGVVYQHDRLNQAVINQNGQIITPYTSNVLGGRAFVYYDVYKSFCPYVEYESSRTAVTQDTGPYNFWHYTVRGGLLYKSIFNDKVFGSLAVLYDFFPQGYQVGQSFFDRLDMRIGFAFYPFRSKRY